MPTKKFTIGNDDLNKEGDETLGEGEKATFIFKDGTITAKSTGYKDKDTLTDVDTVYMLVPVKSDVVFENVTFNSVVNFAVMMYTTQEWTVLKSYSIE